MSCPSGLSQQVACILENLAETGVLPWARHTVNLLYKLPIVQNATYGYQGKITYRSVPVMPPPKLKLTDQLRNINGVITTVGDGMFTNWPQALFTKAQIEEATYIQIDNQTWSLIQGSLVDEADGIFFRGILRRERQNDSLVIVSEI